MSSGKKKDTTIDTIIEKKLTEICYGVAYLIMKDTRRDLKEMLARYRSDSAVYKNIENELAEVETNISKLNELIKKQEKP